MEVNIPDLLPPRLLFSQEIDIPGWTDTEPSVITIENMLKGDLNHFRVALTSIKIVTGWNTYDYALGWTAQVDTT